MAVDYHKLIKADRIVSTMLGVLDRDIVLPQMVWKDAGGNFKGAADDTISVRVPAYAAARTRTMRSAGDKTIDGLNETTVKVDLDTEVYRVDGITQEELTLDITDFEAQIALPNVASVARGIEDSLASTIEGASYETSHTIDIDPADPYATLVRARTILNKSRVPADQRFLAVGADVEEAILNSDHLSLFNQSGTDSAFREAVIGRIAGFTAVSVPGLDPSIMVAAHKTAFVLSTQAPAVPVGAKTGASRTFAGLGLTIVQDYIPLKSDVFMSQCYIGSNVTMDAGTVGSDGVFVPETDPETDDSDKILVRAVLMNMPTSA